MSRPQKDGAVSLVVPPFLKVVLAVIAAALCVIALRGLFGAEPLYAQGGAGTMDVNVRSVSGRIPVEVEFKWPANAIPVDVKGTVSAEVRGHVSADVTTQ